MKKTTIFLMICFSFSALANDRCSIAITAPNSAKQETKQADQEKYNKKLENKLVKLGYNIVSKDKASLVADIYHYPECGITYGDLCTGQFARIYIKDAETEKSLYLAEGRSLDIAIKSLAWSRALNEIKACQ